MDEALRDLVDFPYEDLEWACLDHHRGLRDLLPEVVYGPGKTNDQLVRIAKAFMEKGSPLLVTRVTPEQALAVTAAVPGLEYHEMARAITSISLRSDRNESAPEEKVFVVTGGTSDMPVAEEACITLEMMGQAYERLFDVGVAGVHRLLSRVQKLRQARAIVAVAGMDGVLPSLVGGLVQVPVIAVPVDTGYGANFSGLAPLLTMLNSCAPGVAVVNINNGFGAAVMAAMIARSPS